MILRHVSYICEPRNINIEVHFPVNSRHVIISLIVDNKVAKKTAYFMTDFPTERDTYDYFVEKFCNNFINHTEDQLYMHSKEYMLALNAHRNLKKVLYRTGKKIWERP